MIRYKNHTIQNTIFLYFLVVMILCSVTVATVTYAVSVKILTAKVRSSFTETVSYIGKNIRDELTFITRMMNFFFINPEVKNIVAAEDTGSYGFLKSAETTENAIRNNLLSSSFDYVNEIKLFSTDKDMYTFTDDPRRGYLDGEKILASEYFRSLPAQQGKTVFIASADSQFFRDTSMQDGYAPVIALRAIKDKTYSQDIGAAAMYVSADIFRQHLEDRHFIEGSRFGVLDENVQSVAGGRSVLVPAITERVLNPDSPGGIFSFDADNELVVCTEVQPAGWTLIGAMPAAQAVKDGGLIIGISAAAVLLSVLFSLLLWKRLSVSILTPVNTVSNHLKDLAAGSMRQIPGLYERKDEATELIRNYNSMVVQLKTLIDENIREGLTRKESEYKALQAQINPHFLYNTLNTIRWMAIIHHADNIKTVTEVLSRLLRNTTKSSDGDSTVGEELANVKDYLFIEQLAYQFSFSVEYDIPQDITDIPCIKFLLQPIVENAVLHGLGEKEGSGCLKIGACRTTFAGKPVAEISIFDDGAGIDSLIIEKKQFSGIGITNVSERLKMTYGPEFEPEIHSIKNEFTEVIIRVPCPENGI